MNRPLTFVSQRLALCLVVVSVSVAHLAVAAPKASKKAAVSAPTAMSSKFEASRFSGVRVRHVPQTQSTRSLRSRPRDGDIVLKNERRDPDPRKGVTVDIDTSVMIPIMGTLAHHKTAKKAGSHR